MPLAATIAAVVALARRWLKSDVARGLALLFFAPFLLLIVTLLLVDLDCEMGSIAVFYQCDHLPAPLVQWLSLPLFILTLAGVLLTLPALLLGAIYEAAARIKT